MTTPRKNIVRIAIVVGAFLLFAFVANFTIEGWNWGFADFVIIGALLFGTGLAIDFALRKVRRPLYRVIACTGIVMALLTIWAELAVDAVSRVVEPLL